MTRLAFILSLLLAGCLPAPRATRTATDPAPLAARARAAATDAAFPSLIARIDLAAEAERDGTDPADGVARKLKNPRGYHGVFHAGLDARSPTYVADFAAAFKPWFAGRLDYARDCGAKAIWLLDGEGRQYDQPTSWLGNWWTCAPPEMTPDLRRWMVNECRTRGLIFGVTVRHTVPTALANGNVAQVLSGTPADAYIANVQAARWGLGNPTESAFRFVYLDTNVYPESDGVKGAFPPSIIGSVGNRLPIGLYVATEFSTPGYAALPNVGALRDADRPKGAYRGVNVIMPPHRPWTPTPEDEARIVAEVKGGDVLVFTGSWPAPENDWILRCWNAAQAD